MTNNNDEPFKVLDTYVDLYTCTIWQTHMSRDGEITKVDLRIPAEMHPSRHFQTLTKGPTTDFREPFACIVTTPSPGLSLHDARFYGYRYALHLAWRLIFIWPVHRPPQSP